MAKIAGIPITLGDVERVVPPLNLRALREMQGRIRNFKPGDLSDEAVDTIAKCTFLALKRNYPDITQEEIDEHVDVGNMIEIMEAVMDVSGLKRKKAEEAKRLGETTGATTPAASSAGQTSSGT